MNEDSRQSLARLSMLVALDEARIKADPVGAVRVVEERYTELLKVLEEVEYALSPDVVFDWWEEHGERMSIPQPVDVQGEALIRCDKALEVIGRWKRGKR